MKEKTLNKWLDHPLIDLGKYGKRDGDGYSPSRLLRSTALYVLLFFCVFIPFRSVIAELTFEKVKVVTDLLTIGLFLWFSWDIKFRYRFYLHDLFFLGFLLLGFVSTVLINRNGIGPFVVQVRSIGIYYVFYFVIRNFDYGKEEFMKVVRTLQTVCVPLFLLAVVERISWKTVLFPVNWATSIYRYNYNRVYGMFDNPNTFGLFVTLVVILSFIARIYLSKKTSVLMYIVMAFSIWLTMSRSSFIALAVAAAAMLVLLIVTKRVRVDWKVLLLCTVLVVESVVLLDIGITAMSDSYFDNVIIAPVEHPGGSSDLPSDASSGSSSDLTSGEGEVDQDGNKIDKELANKFQNFTDDNRDQSFIDRLGAINDRGEISNSNSSGRLLSVKTSLKVLRDYPLLGAGFGSFGSAANQSYPSKIAAKYGLSSAHFYSDIEYAKVVAENGALGVLLFGAFLLAILYRCRGSFFKLAFCVMIGWFGLFFNIFEVQIGAMLFWSMLAFQDFKLPDAKSGKSAETPEA